MLIPRIADARVETLARAFPAVIVTGPRQAGKTTLVRKMFPEHHFVSLDLPSLAEQAEREPERFFGENPAPVIIDEVQYAPGLYRHLKRSIDEHRDTNGAFILTGSQKLVLMKEVSDSVAGRAGLIDLENFSHRDLRAASLIDSSRSELLTAMARGFFPELWKERELPHADFFRSYLATYLERDVRAILNVTSLRDFERSLRVLATRSATLLNKTDIAKDVGISPKAMGDWMSVLETSGTISLLEPWFTNFGKRIVKGARSTSTTPACSATSWA